MSWFLRADVMALALVLLAFSAYAALAGLIGAIGGERLERCARCHRYGLTVHGVRHEHGCHAAHHDLRRILSSWPEHVHVRHH